MSETPSTLKEKLRALPDKPGCYLMRNRSGRIIYVGKAASLRKRVQSYFRNASLRRGDPKLRSLVNSIADIEIIELHNEAAAVLTEAKHYSQSSSPVCTSGPVQYRRASRRRAAWSRR